MPIQFYEDSDGRSLVVEVRIYRARLQLCKRFTRSGIGMVDNWRFCEGFPGNTR